MIPYDVDPSLHTSEPHEPLLGDGFSPPEHGQAALPPQQPQTPATPAPIDPLLRDKSDF